MSDVDWETLVVRMTALSARNGAKLSDEDREYVRHYVAVGEWEMALEILCLALMTNPSVPLSDLEELRELAIIAGLDRESVFDGEFWKNFSAALDDARRRVARGPAK